MSGPILTAERVSAEGRAPASSLFVLHGIYGAGRNWASLIRRLVRERPEVGGVLVDLREHGGSHGFAPPHTLAAAAADVAELAGALAVRPEGVLGHSFGGKVALQYAQDHPTGLRQVWVVDSTPSSREPSGSAWEMLERLRELPGPFETRNEVVQALRAKGIAAPVAQWMATNVERANGSFRWRFDLDAVEALLRDFFRRDLWSAVEAPPDGLEVHIVKAEESSILSEDEVARVEAAGARSGRVHLHRVGGGHWVNADNPDALLELLLAHL